MSYRCGKHKKCLYNCLYLQVVRSRGVDESSDRLSTIDYFGAGPTNGAQSISEELQEEEEYELESKSEDSGAGGKRKKKGVDKDVRTKKKKTKSNQIELEGKECGCLVITANY